MSSTSLQVVPDLSNLTNLVELELNDNSNIGEQDRRIHTGDLRWIGRLSELEKLSLRLLHVPAPNELASLPKLNQLHLSGLDLQTFTQVPSSLLERTLEDCQSTALLSSNLNNLSDLYLINCQMQEIKFDGLQLPNLTVLYLNHCEPLEKFMLSSTRKLKQVSANYCPKLDEIHIAGVLESLEELLIHGCNSFGRLVYVDTQQQESSPESSLILASGVFSKLRKLWLLHCYKILSIQVVGTLESLEGLSLRECHHLRSLGGLSNLRNLRSLHIKHDHDLRIVEGLDKLEFLNKLFLYNCLSLESLIDVSATQLPDDCRLYIKNCPKLRGAKQGFEGSVQYFKKYEAKMNARGQRTRTFARTRKDGGTPVVAFKRSRATYEQAAAPATGPAAAAAAAAADLAELFGELALRQQHVAVEGGRGDVEVGSVHFQGQGGGGREEEHGAKRQRR
ncbi:hypothetical protein NL676_009094 [Syzygium grande]|nr:hypothetical protein NL676_009094 [Syzygium grande]